MYYIELLRLRRSFIIYGGILGALFLLSMITTHWPGAVVNKGDSGIIPLSVLLSIVGFGAIIWAAAGVVLALLMAATARSAGLHEVIMVLNLLNPLAYLSSSAHVQIGVDAGAPTLIPHDVWTRAAMTWGFGLFGSLAAIVGWKRLEV